MLIDFENCARHKCQWSYDFSERTDAPREADMRRLEDECEWLFYGATDSGFWDRGEYSLFTVTSLHSLDYVQISFISTDVHGEIHTFRANMSSINFPFLEVSLSTGLLPNTQRLNWTNNSGLIAIIGTLRS